jgi:hypothetical protein
MEKLIEDENKSLGIKNKSDKNKNDKNKSNKKKKSKPKFYLRWSFYFILATLLFTGLFAWSEKDIETKQPSENWSIGVEVLTELPADYRLIDQVALPNGEGIAVAYYDKLGMHLSTMDWYGKVIETGRLKLDDYTIKLIELTSSEDDLYLFYSDRTTLNRMRIDPITLESEDAVEISKHAEQFAAEGDSVVAGDDTVTEIFKGTDLVATFDDYDNVKRLNIATSGDKVIVMHNAADGGRLLTYQADALNVLQLADEADQMTYGYFKDLHIENGVLTLISSYYNHLAPNAPTVLGVWQLEEATYKEISFKLFYHVRTSLEPVITDVEGKKVSYILGTQQTLDSVNKGLSKYPQTKGGLFTNVSHFTREDDVLVENTRLTLTRQYPVGYEVFHAPFGDVLTWADKVSGKTNLNMAGQGEDWIGYAKSKHETNYLILTSAALMGFGNTIFFGVISLLISLTPFMWWIVAVCIIAYLYNRFMPVAQEKRGKQVLFGMMVFTIALKLFLVAGPNSDFRFYSQIYPWLFGSTLSLVSMSVFTSLLSVWMYFLWQKQHYYYANRYLKYAVFFGFELYLFMISTMAYFVTAMMKSNFML